MGNFQSNYVENTTNIYNDILNASVEGCTATCNQISSGNVVIFDGGNIGGNVNVLNQSCRVDANCVMQNVAETDLSNIIQDTVQQKNTSVGASMFDGIGDQENTNINTENVSNYITQILQSTCQASIWMNSSDNFLFYSANTGGNFSALNQGDSSTSASASCAMSNISKLKVANSVSNSTTQANTSVGLFGMIILVILLIILFPIIIVMIRGVLKSNKDKKSSEIKIVK